MIKKIGLLVGSVALIAAFAIGSRMDSLYAEKELWQYEALFLFVSCWIALNSFLFHFSADKQAFLKGIGLASLSGALLTLGFSPFSFPITIFVGLIPILVLLEEASFKKRFYHIYSGILLWNILATFWIANTSLGSGIFANVANAGLSMIPIGLYWFFKKQFGDRFKWLLFISFWISWEWFHMQWDLSWPWLNLGNAFGMAPNWVQWYEWTGIFGGSLWVLLVNIALYQVYVQYKQSAHFKSLVKPALLLVIPLAVSAGFYNFRNLELSSQFKALVIQPDYEPHFEKFTVTPNQQSKEVKTLITAQLDSSYNYLVLPESVFNRFDIRNPGTNSGMRMLEKIVQRYPDLTIIGGAAAYRIFDQPDFTQRALRKSERNGNTIWYVVYNAAFSLSQKKGYDWYFKSKLVPGAEIFPFRDLLFFAEPIVKSVGGSFEGHGIQEQRSVFEDYANVAPVICYESVYGEYMSDYIKNGANAIFVLTNDGWWARTPGHRQHLGFSRLRAIEFRRVVIRAANTGISCWIDPFGVVQQATDYAEEAAFTAEVLAYENMTFYARYGDIIAKMCLLVAILFSLSGLAKWLQGRKP